MTTPRHRLLVADDDELFGKAVVRLLRSPTRSIVHVSSANSALELVSRERYDLVWSDRDFHQALGGVDLLCEAAARLPEATLFLVSGDPDHPSVSRLPPRVRIFRKSDVNLAAAEALHVLGDTR